MEAEASRAEVQKGKHYAQKEADNKSLLEKLAGFSEFPQFWFDRRF
jgi:hypothetical protein